MAGDWNATTDDIDVGTWNVGAIQTFTAFMWVYVDAFTVTDARFLSKASGTATADHEWMLGQVDSSGQKWRMRLRAGGATATLIGNATMNSGQWYHGLMEYDASDNLTIFVDGTQDNTAVHGTGGAMDTSAKAIFIGNNAGDAKGVDGALADMAVLSSLISNTHKSALARGVHPFGMVDLSEAFWSLWLNNTTTTPEFSGNGRTGTITSVTKRAHPPVELMENYL